MKKEIAKALKDLESVWDEPAAKGGMMIPAFDEGSGRITDMSFEMSGKNKPMIVTTVTIVEPEKLEGREVKRFDTISKEHFVFFKGFAEQIGLELPSSADPEELEAAVTSFIEDNDTVYPISVTHEDGKDGKTYTRLNILSDVTSDDDDDDKKEDDDDDAKPSKERTALLAKIKKNKLKVDADDFDDDDDLEEAVNKAMKKKKK